VPIIINSEEHFVYFVIKFAVELLVILERYSLLKSQIYLKENKTIKHNSY